MKKYAIRLAILAAVVVGLFFLVKATPLGSYVQSIEENRAAFKQQVAENYTLSVALYILLYVVVVALSIPGATVLSILGGFFFGPVLGTLYINAGATAGALIVCLAARFFLGDMIQNRYGERLERFNGEIAANGSNYMLTLRFIPVFPFFMINLFAGVTRLPLWTFVWTTALGIIPGSAVFAYSGHALATVSGFPTELLIALVLLGLLSLLPVVVRKVRARKNAQGA